MNTSSKDILNEYPRKSSVLKASLRYSFRYKLKRGVTWLLRFAEFIRQKKGSLLGCVDDPLTHGTLSVEQLQSSEFQIIKYI